MKKTMKLLGMISMVVICATACGTQEPQEETKAVQSEQNKNGTVQETTNDNAEFNISADVNHDGREEKLKVTVNKESTGDFLDFVVMKEDSDEIICEEKGYWQEKKDLAYYLYNDGAESYIIKYWPQMAQGTADYS